jgi:hypothetical protein
MPLDSSLAAIAARLRARCADISAELEAMGPTKAGGVPDYKGPGGVSHVAYRESLWKELRDGMAQLALWGDPDLATGNDGGDAVRYVDI